MTDETQEKKEDTSTSQKQEGQTESAVETGATAGQETDQATPYKTFLTEQDFNRHAVGILNDAKKKTEKELLAMLGLKPDEKDKLQKFKEAYESTLSEAEKQKQRLEDLDRENSELKKNANEKEILLSALMKVSGKKTEDVDKIVKMARGLVDENTTIDQAIEYVMNYSKPSVPHSEPLAGGSAGGKVVENPFKTGNLTEQGKLMKEDIAKARELYKQVHNKEPNW